MALLIKMWELFLLLFLLLLFFFQWFELILCLNSASVMKRLNEIMLSSCESVCEHAGFWEESDNPLVKAYPHVITSCHVLQSFIPLEICVHGCLFQWTVACSGNKCATWGRIPLCVCVCCGKSRTFFVQLKSSEERLVMCKPTSLFTFQVFLFGGLHEAKFFLCFFCYFTVIVVVTSFLPICGIEKNSQNR